MPYLDETLAPAPAELPPEEQIPPPPEYEAGREIHLGEYAPAPVAEPIPEPEAPHGVLHDIGDTLGGAVQPIVDVLPTPVQNLADIVGQPVGGLVDAATEVGGKLKQGDIGGAALAGLTGTAGQVGEHVTEVTGQRVAEGKPPFPQNEVLEDPGQIPAMLGGFVANIPRPGKQKIEDWAAANPDEVDAAYEAGGGSGVIDAYLESTGAVSTPPPQLSNPIDAGAGAGNILQSAANVVGAIPESLGGWVDSAQKGTLAPFLESQAAYALMDPLSFLPPAWGDAAWGAAGRAARAGLSRAPGAAGRALEKTAAEAARLEAEGAKTAGAEMVTSRRTMLDESPPAGATATGVTPGPEAVMPTLDNGPQVPTPDMGQPAAAAPPPPPLTTRQRNPGGAWQGGEPLPPPGSRQAVPDANAPRTAPRQPVAPRDGDWTRAGPAVRRKLVGDPENPTHQIDATGVGQNERFTVREIVDGVPQRGTTYDTLSAAQDAIRRTRKVSPTTGDPVDVPVTPKPKPTKTSLGLRGSNWIDAQGRDLVRGRGTQTAHIRPAFVDTVDAVYDDMWNAPSAEFSQPYGDWSAKNLPASDVGNFARYRGAMTQGLYMLDDWPASKVASRLPAVNQGGGMVDWNAVDSLATSTDTMLSVPARKAKAGKKWLDLYAHRFAGGTDGMLDPDVEVSNAVMQYHMDQLSDRFQDPKQYGERYWRDRADLLGEAMRDAGYQPSPQLLDRLRRMDLAVEAKGAFPDLPDERVRMARMAGKNLFDPDPSGYGTIVVNTPNGQRVPLTVTTPELQRVTDILTPDKVVELEANLRLQLDAYGLGDIGVTLLDDLESVTGVEGVRGRYSPSERVITLALREADDFGLDAAERTMLGLDHEVVHALRDLGLFTKKEWDALVQAARDPKNGIDQLINARYADELNLPPDRMDGEFVAHLYEAWRQGKIDPTERPLLQRMMDFFTGIGKALKDTYPEDVLRRIESGEIGSRPRQAIEDVATVVDETPEMAVRRTRLSLEQDLADTQALLGVEPDPELRGVYENRLRELQETFNSDEFSIPRRNRAAADAAYSNAPPAVRAGIAEEAVENPITTPYGIIVSEQAARDLALPSEGKFKFKDGYTGNPGLTKEDLLLNTLSDVEYWANVEEMGNWTNTADAELNPHWQQLNKRFNPDGSVDRQALRGVTTDQAKQALRDDFSFRVWSEAQDAALPSSAPKGTFGKLNATYMGFVRRNMLFNVFRVPSYILQNQITNTINLGAKIGPGAVLDYWTSPGEWRNVFRSAKAASKGEKHYTFWGSLEKQIGMGHKPNIPMTHSQYLERTSGKLTGLVGKLSKVAAPDTAQFMGQVPDQFAREAAATSVTMRGFRKLNQELSPRVTAELHARGVAVSPNKVDAIIREFLDMNRTVTDANTGRAFSTITNRAGKFEPVWNPDDFGQFLKKRLTEDMASAPDPTLFRNAVDRVVRDTKSAVRSILDDAEAATDAALFDWRSTNADEALSKVFFFHYWQSRQGGLYISEMIKRPGILTAYGRMMEEMNQQAEELNQPDWMKGFFQFQNSVAGFSTWFSPFDLAQSLLTFADWQMGADESAYKDLTALGKMAGQSPFLIHPLLQFVAYEIGALGPDAYAPPATGLETFGARAIDLLNLGNAQDAGFMAPFNAMGIGVDEYGNKVPIPVRPLQELYAKWGNAISTALAPITGLDPVEVSNMAGSQERNINAIVEQDLRRNNPNLDQMEVLRMRDEILSDHGSEEYQSAYRKASEMPYMSSSGIGGLGVQGLSRLVSPVPIYNWVEQTNLDRWNVEDSGYATPRNIPGLGETTGELDAEGNPIPTDAGAIAADIANASKYGSSSTQEARELGVQRIEYDKIMSADMQEANAQAGALFGALDGELTENVMIGGQEYTPDQLGGMTSTQLFNLGTQLLADYGYTREQVQETKNAQARYLADHPDVAAYKAYTDLVGNVGAEQFTQQTALENPGFAQFARSSMVDQTTGVIDYEKAFNPDAFLASQGVRPSVYSPVVGNEPSRVAGGYPALAGGPTDQPLLPQATSTADIPMFEKTGDADGGYYDDPPIATLGAGAPVQILKPPDEFSKGLALVSFGKYTGYVDAGLLSNASPAPPAGPVGVSPAPIEPTGGIASVLGGITAPLGAAKDAIFNALGGATADVASPEATFHPYAAGTSGVDPRQMTTDSTGQELIDLANQYEGVPYQHNFPGASDDPWSTGWDCSSFIHWLADNAGVSEKQYPNDPGYKGGGVPVGSHFQWQWAEANDLVVGDSWQAAQPGDAIYFETDPARETCDPANYNGCMNNDASHVGLYLGIEPSTGRPLMMHAAAPGVGTVYDYLDTYPYPVMGVVEWLPGQSAAIPEPGEAA